MVLIWWQITWYTWLYLSWDYGILISDTKNPYRGWWSQWISGGWNHWVLEIETRWCFCWSYFTNKNLEVLNLTSLFWISIVVIHIYCYIHKLGACTDQQHPTILIQNKFGILTNGNSTKHWSWPLEIPSGKRLHFSWENSLFLWPFSMANRKRLPEGSAWNQQRLDFEPTFPYGIWGFLSHGGSPKMDGL